MNPLRIATRKSALALWQAEEVQRRLESIDVASDLVRMSTRGDEIIDKPLAAIGGKGLFIKELQRGMMDGRADLAVHSMKDVPAEFPEGLHLVVVLEREDPRDALVSNRYASIEELPVGARVGTCSLRRQCQLLEKRPDLNLLDLRGNVNTRLQKLDDGEFDAIILACAGLIRLGLGDRIRMAIPVEDMLPACGQGIVGIECKVDDAATNSVLARLHDKSAAIRVGAERSLNAVLGGSCKTPIASYAEHDEHNITLSGLVGLPDGSQILRVTETAGIDDGVELGRLVAEKLLAAGAAEIIRQFDLG